MPEDMVNPVTHLRTSSGVGSGTSTTVKGDRAGESSAVFDAAAKATAARAKDDARQKWISKNFPGLGGRVKMNKDPDWEKRFNEEYAKSQGQKDALKEPKTAATPKP
jgi:hypothetical protein